MTQSTHLTADGYISSTSQLANEQLLKDFFQQIDTNALTKIIVYEDPIYEEMNGVTGVLLAPGMHTTVHTYTHKNKACYFFDFFNYQPLLHERSRDILEEKYAPKLYISSLVKRTTEVQNETFESFYTPPSNYYGPHLMIEAISDIYPMKTVAIVIEEYLWRLPTLIGMHPLTAPHLVESAEWISGIRVIAESHISVHVEKATGNIFFDIFSCKGFEEEKVLHYSQNMFTLKQMKKTLLHRGTHFHKQMMEQNYPTYTESMAK